MGTQPASVEAVFYAALEKRSLAERAAYVEDACGKDTGLRVEVESLLTAHENVGTFFERPVADSPLPANGVGSGKIRGTVIGRYKLVERIGEGGFGAVYMAEQTEPVRRQVALKIIKLGMDTEQVIARFEAERQALAMMDHPNIAKVLDAGATDTGRPYFVMELVRGLPIIEHCDQNSLTTKDRLELFIDVCRAIQHAHLKGVIHRDIKPSNVLVAVVDGRPVPKVIDFGIAKATQKRLTEKTFFTGDGQFLGTPEYMSPEQAGMSDLHVDIRTDVYSLGVLLYELLVGRTPFDPEQLRQAGYDEICRIIRETDPRTPSRKLSTLGASATDVSKHRQVQPTVLRKQLRGDLDCIVMKTLEKDREDRYATSAALADDLRRFLDEKPIEAQRPTPVRRLAKWSRRHRTAVTTAAVTLFITLSICAAIVVRAYRAERFQRHVAEQQKAQAVKHLGIALEAVDQLYAQFHEWLSADTELSVLQVGFLEQALDVYKQLLEQQGEDEPAKQFAVTTNAKIARIHLRMQQYAEARTALEHAIAIEEELLAQRPDQWEYRAELVANYNRLSNALGGLNLHNESLEALDQARNHATALASLFPDAAEYQIDLVMNDQNRAATLLSIGHLDEAERLARGAQHRWSELANRDSPLDIKLNVIRNDALLASVLMNQGKFADALALADKALRHCTPLRWDYWDHRGLAQVTADLTELLGQIHLAAARPEEATMQFRKALELQRQLLKIRMKPIQHELAVFFKAPTGKDGYEEPELTCGYIETQLRLAAALRQLDRPYEAELVLGEAVQMSQILADMYSDVVRYRAARANSCAEVAGLLQDRRPDEAAQALDMAAAIWHDTVAQCANAADFRSGVRGRQNDLQWFVAKYPEQSIGAGAPELKSVRLGGESVFSNHTTGVMSYEAELWKMAVRHFTKSAELRRDGQAFDWYYLAMANWQLNEQEEARRWFEQAQQWIEEHMQDDKELEKLREQAAALLALTEEISP